MIKTVIDIGEIENFVNNKTFNEVKTSMESNGVRVRESKSDILDNLYLLVSETDNSCNNLEIQCNGVILEKETNKIVCMSHNKILKNIDQNDYNELKEKHNLSLEYCEDGTVIRLYNYKGKWYTATTKCIDARYSYWSSEKTFDEMFWDVFDKTVLDTLHEEYTYSFVLLHTENRIVVDHKKNDILYISRTNNITKEDDCSNIFSYVRVENTESIVSVDKLEDCYVPSKRGVLVRCIDNGRMLTYQYDFKKYDEIKKIRGNVPLLRMRYLELLNDPDSLRLLETYYPESQLLFAMIKHCVGNLYKEIHQLYYKSHIKHTIRVKDDHLLYRTLTQLHGIHKKQNVVITLEEVKKKVDTLDKTVLKNLLRWV